METSSLCETSVSSALPADNKPWLTRRHKGGLSGQCPFRHKGGTLDVYGFQGALQRLTAVAWRPGWLIVTTCRNCELCACQPLHRVRRTHWAGRLVLCADIMEYITTCRDCQEKFSRPFDQDELTRPAVQPGEVLSRLTCAYGITTCLNCQQFF